MRRRNRLTRRLLGTLRRDPDVPQLVSRGLKIGSNVTVARDVFLAALCPWLLTIGNDVAIGMHATIFTHDSSAQRKLGYTLVGPVVIADRAYIGALSIVFPGVTIGEDAVVLAGSVVRDDVPAGAVVAGAPARVICTADEYAQSMRARLADIPPYESIWAIEGVGGSVPAELMERMRADLADGRLGLIP